MKKDIPYAAIDFSPDGKVQVWSDGNVVLTLPLQDACRAMLAHEEMAKALEGLLASNRAMEEGKCLTGLEAGDEDTLAIVTQLEAAEDAAHAALTLAKGE